MVVVCELPPSPLSTLDAQGTDVRLITIEARHAETGEVLVRYEYIALCEKKFWNEDAVLHRRGRRENGVLVRAVPRGAPIPPPLVPLAMCTAVNAADANPRTLIPWLLFV